MVFQKEFLFIIFLVHFNVAINLNIFSFNKAPIKNISKSDISIEPTATLSTSIKITQSPQMMDLSSGSDSFPNVDNEKYEFENEPEGEDASPESSAESNSTVSVPGQEIDETRNSSRYFVTEKNVESGPILGKFTLAPYLPSFPEITFPMLPSLSKKKTITFTKTLVSKFTKYEIVYPSCLEVGDVKSVCNGSLTTIQPTPAFYSQNVEQTSTVFLGEENASYDVVEPPENRKRRTTNNTSKSTKDWKKRNFGTDLIEPSEPDYDFEVIDFQQATPTSAKLLNGFSKPSNFIESLLIHEPKINFVTEFLSVTSVRTITDRAVTATVIAHSCLPTNVNLKSCPKPSQLPKIPLSVTVVPILYSKEKEKIENNHHKYLSSSPKPEKIVTSVYEPEKPYNIMDELNKYLIMNANRLMKNPGGGYEAIDLNADSVIIEAPGYYP